MGPADVGMEVKEEEWRGAGILVEEVGERMEEGEVT